MELMCHQQSGIVTVAPHIHTLPVLGGTGTGTGRWYQSTTKVLVGVLVITRQVGRGTPKAAMRQWCVAPSIVNFSPTHQPPGMRQRRWAEEGLGA